MELVSPRHWEDDLLDTAITNSRQIDDLVQGKLTSVREWFQQLGKTKNTYNLPLVKLRGRFFADKPFKIKPANYIVKKDAHFFIKFILIFKA